MLRQQWCEVVQQNVLIYEAVANGGGVANGSGVANGGGVANDGG